MLKMPKVISLEEITKRLLNNHNGNIEIYNYSSSKQKAHFKCLICGYQWDALAGLVANGDHGCPNCAIKNNKKCQKYSDEYVKNYIESFGCQWIDGQYLGANSKLIIRFSCGHSEEKSFTSFQTGNRCSICSLKEKNDKLRTKESDIIKIIESYGFEFVGFPNGYFDQKSYVQYKCNCGHITTRKWYNFKKNQTCRECSLNVWGDRYVSSKDKVNKFILSKNAKWISGEYKNQKSKLIIEFECGHIQEVSYYLFHMRNSKLCYDCALENRVDKSRFSKENIIKCVEDHNFIFSKFLSEYKNNNTKIEYLCKEFNHLNIRTVAGFYKAPTCKECFKLETRKYYFGERNYGWGAGISSLRDCLKSTIYNWRNESINLCNGLCVVEGKKFEVVHHLYGFGLILKDIFLEINMPIRKSVTEYTIEELEIIRNKIIEKHNLLLGVCLTKRVHKFFHKLYGNIDNTPAQFEEFKQRIQSGEIVLPE
jgi:hypothetical protein